MDVPEISKDQAIEAYGGNAAALARALGITPSAVYQWPDGPVAEHYALKLRFVLKPDVFGGAAELRRAKAAPEGEAAAETAPTLPVTADGSSLEEAA